MVSRKTMLWIAVFATVVAAILLGISKDSSEGAVFEDDVSGEVSSLAK